MMHVTFPRAGHVYLEKKAKFRLLSILLLFDRRPFLSSPIQSHLTETVNTLNTVH